MSLYSNVQSQIKHSFQFLKDDFSHLLLERLLYPDQVIEMPISIMMDDGNMKTFSWYRSQYDNTLGPYKWGLRFHQDVTKDKVMSLSAWMTMKTAIVGIPLGWGKWGITIDPKKLSKWELQRLSRTFMQKLAPHIGPDKDIPAPDVNTNPQIVAWMADEYAKVTGKRTPWVITGKPLSIGGSQWRTEATSLWGFYVLTEFFKQHQDTIEGKSIAIQWAGNVWLNFAEIADKAWAKVIAISDSQWWIYNVNWLDINKIKELKENKNSVIEYTDAKKISNEELLELKVDILAPSALEKVLHKDNANNIHATIILELANGPTTPEADKILNAKHTFIIPDILANAGWVTVSYFEQVQNNTNYYRSKEEVYEKLEKIIKPATTKVIQTAEQYKTPMRDGAYILALKRILEVIRVRKDNYTYHW